MNKTLRQNRSQLWTDPDANAPSQEGYDAALAEDIAKGVEHLDTDQSAPAKKVWKQLGLE